MSNCKICKRLVASTTVTVTATALVINIPDRSYDNCEKLCLLVNQEVPATATRGLPVVVTIGTDTTQFPLINCKGLPVTQEYIANGNVYKSVVLTTTTSAVIKVLCELSCACTNLQSIPVAAATTGG
jgi:hypothetical protein